MSLLSSSHFMHIGDRLSFCVQGFCSHCTLPSLEELCLQGLESWITTDLLHLLTCQANINGLVPALEVHQRPFHTLLWLHEYDWVKMGDSGVLSQKVAYWDGYDGRLVSWCRDFESLVQMQTGRDGHIDCKHPRASGLARWNLILSISDGLSVGNFYKYQHLCPSIYSCTQII